MRTEKIFFVLFLIGYALKMAHYPGGNILTILSLMPLSLMYFPFGFYFLSNKKIDNKTVGFSVLTGFCLSILVAGDLFELMHWPGGLVVMGFGLLSCLPIAVISYQNQTKPKEEENSAYYKNIFLRAMVFVILGLLTTVL